MPKIAYRTQRFNSKARKTVDQAKIILEDLAGQGYTLTLRQLFYQFVRRNWLPNNQKEYKRLGRIVCDAREVGEIDWLHIEDRGRGCVRIDEVPTWQKALEGLEHGLLINPWLDQDVYLEVAVEKDAQVGIVARPASKWRAPYIACKGYLSASEAWRMGLRYQRAIAADKRPILIHLGDHDPSGLHMTLDNATRLGMFSRYPVEVNRIALSRDQVEEHDCPPNPTKSKDTRSAGYEAQGHEASWELDALPPIYLDSLIADTIEQYIDKDKWRASLEREAELREPLSRFAPRWEELIELVGMDEKPLERLKILDSIVADMPYHLGQAAFQWPRSLKDAIANSHAVDRDALTMVQKPADPIQGKEDELYDEGIDKGLELAAKALEGVKPLVWSEDLTAQANVTGLSHMKERLEEVERVPFELPEDHVVPAAEMPWDVLEEADKDMPDGYTDEDPEGLIPDDEE